MNVEFQTSNLGIPTVQHQGFELVEKQDTQTTHLISGQHRQSNGLCLKKRQHLKF